MRYFATIDTRLHRPGQIPSGEHLPKGRLYSGYDAADGALFGEDHLDETGRYIRATFRSIRSAEAWFRRHGVEKYRRLHCTVRAVRH